MKIFFYPFLVAAFLISCSTSADYLKSTDPDFTYFKLVQKLQKNPSDKKAIEYIPAVYQRASERHLTIIRDLQESKDTNKVENIFREYKTLQQLFDTANIVSDIAVKAKAKSYQNEIAVIQTAYTEKYYRMGVKAIASENRNDKLQAIDYFKKVLFFNDQYKDAKEKLNEAYKRSMVNVVITPLINSPTNSGIKFEQVVRDDLVRKDKKTYPADYFTADEITKKNIVPDWIVYVSVSNMDVAAPTVSSNTTNYTKRVENGRDTLGRVIYETVYGSVTNERTSGSAKALVNITIVDTNTGDDMYDSTFVTGSSYSNETRTFSGDPRADGYVQTGGVPGSYVSPYDQLMAGIKNSLPSLVERQILCKVANKELDEKDF